jgi:hypothetical protein
VLGSASADLRRLACGTLQALGARAAFPALVLALADPEPRVSDAAWKALCALTGMDLPRDVEVVRSLLARS